MVSHCLLVVLRAHEHLRDVSLFSTSLPTFFLPVFASHPGVFVHRTISHPEIFPSLPMAVGARCFGCDYSSYRRLRLSSSVSFPFVHMLSSSLSPFVCFFTLSFGGFFSLLCVYGVFSLLGIHGGEEIMWLRSCST